MSPSRRSTTCGDAAAISPSIACVPAASTSCTATSAPSMILPTRAPSTCCSSAPRSRPCTQATMAARLTLSTPTCTGTINCLEAARRYGADVIFLSTSRVYPIERLRALPLERRGSTARRSRRRIRSGLVGQTALQTDFPLAGYRSMYGATKLASELLIEEYRAMYGLRTIVNRCGVISGPWQMGKVDQGFVVLWAARHLYGGPLSVHRVSAAKGCRSATSCTSTTCASWCAADRRPRASLTARPINVGGGPEQQRLARRTDRAVPRARRHAPIPIEQQPADERRRRAVLRLRQRHM